MGFEEEKNEFTELEEAREKTLESFTVGDLDNPVTEKSIEERLENIDAAIEDTDQAREMNEKIEGGTM